MTLYDFILFLFSRKYVASDAVRRLERPARRWIDSVRPTEQVVGAGIH